MTGLRALLIDDEQPALDELEFLLRQDDRIGSITTAGSGTEALRLLQQTEVDVVFLDIQMPGLSGLELAEVFSQFRSPPPLVFVSAHEQHGVRAFDLNAVDYVLKPVRRERLQEAVRRVTDWLGPEPGERDSDEQIPVERAGVTRFISRREIRWVEAEGDYARLHTADESYLVRVPLSTLAERWAEHGFVRIHRSTLVPLSAVSELRNDSGRISVRIDDVELPVSRRQAASVRALLRRTDR